MIRHRNQETLEELENYLRKRRIYISLIVISTILLLFVLNLGSWVFLNRMKEHLDLELGKRLVSVASLTSQMIEGELIGDLLPTPEKRLTLLIIQDILRRVRIEHQLEGAFIIDRSNRVLVDSRGDFPFGEEKGYIAEDSLVVRRAWAGEVLASPLHLVEGNRFKNAYAPVHNMLGEIVGVLTLEASADFFLLLKKFGKNLVLIGIASFGVLVLFSLALYRAISLLIKTQESLRQSEKLAIMGRMAAGVAHEIRNPLGIIKGTADLLRSRYDNKEKHDELFDYIPAEVSRLNKLVNDFLSFARERELNLALNDFNSTVRKSVAMMDGEFSQSKVEVLMELSEEVPPFLYDEDAVKQILLNILLNSLQSISDEGKITIRTRKRNLKKGQFLEVSIEDTGSGIEGDVQRIFEPFYTTKEGGSGLGLAITKRLIEQHGGWVEVESQKGMGTKFRFYLPIKSKA